MSTLKLKVIERVAEQDKWEQEQEEGFFKQYSKYFKKLLQTTSVSRVLCWNYNIALNLGSF